MGEKYSVLDRWGTHKSHFFLRELRNGYDLLDRMNPMEAENGRKFEQMGMREIGLWVGEAESGGGESERKGL